MQVSKLQWLWSKAVYLFAVVGLLGAGYCVYAIGWVAWRDVNDFYTMRRWVATEMNKQRLASKPVDPFAVPK